MGKVIKWTDTCTGCFNSEDGHPVGQYEWDEKAECFKGMGCSECGYTGKRRWTIDRISEEAE